MKFNIVNFKKRKKELEFKGLECLNCKQPLKGNENFCSYCGQKNSTKKLSFIHFLNNLFSGFFSYDSRFWTTFIPLLTKPGKVSKDYISGKRVRFVNPFQLYLNVSIIFFLLLGFTNKFETNNRSMDNLITVTPNFDTNSDKGTKQLDSVLSNIKQEIDKENVQDSTKAEVITNLGSVFKIVETETAKKEKDSLPFTYHITTNSAKEISILNKLEDFQHYHKNHPNETNLQALKKLGYPITFWNKFYYQQIITTYKNIEQIKSDGGKSYIKTLTSYISISLFVFLPIFTMFLTLLYIRRNYSYMEHLVFVFHTQTVFFLLFIIFYLMNLFVEMESVTWVFITLFLLYLYKALRVFYKQRRFKTIVKYILLNSYYMFLAGVGFVIVSVVSFLFG
jgi:hypothetical protein